MEKVRQDTITIASKHFLKLIFRLKRGHESLINAFMASIKVILHLHEQHATIEVKVFVEEPQIRAELLSIIRKDPKCNSRHMFGV